jgi:hypothetical protein
MKIVLVSMFIIFSCLSSDKAGALEGDIEVGKSKFNFI